MKKGIARFTSFCLTAGLTIGVGSTALLAGRTENRDSVLVGLIDSDDAAQIAVTADAAAEQVQVLEPSAVSEGLVGITDTAAPAEAAQEAPAQDQEAQDTTAAALVEEYLASKEAEDTASDDYEHIIEENDAAAEAPAEEAVVEEAAPVEEAVVEEAAQEEQPAAAEEVIDEQAAPAAEETYEAVEAEQPTPEPEVLDTSMVGTTGFAQCGEYLNVRADASSESDVIGKIYNNGSLEILDVAPEGWYYVRSGNVEGYVASQYVAIGDEAAGIAASTGYTTAYVGADTLNVRSSASGDSEIIATVSGTSEIEVVEDQGEWIKVILDGEMYGYVSADYVYTSTAYATGETLEEEEERLNQQWLDYLAQQEAEQAAAEAAYLASLEQNNSYESTDNSYTEETYTETYSEPSSSGSTDYSYTAPSVSTSGSADELEAQANDLYQAYLDAQAKADAAVANGEGEQAIMDSAAAAQSAYQTYVTARNAADNAAAGLNGDGSTPAADTTSTQTEASSTGSSQPAEEAAPAAQAAPAVSSAGQAIANYACQFVGNPYVYGGASLTGGADCSGFTMAVMANFGIGLPHNAAAQSGCGTPVSLDALQPGDLLFYNGSGGIGHVSIYIGNGQVVHASNPTNGILISSIGYRTPVAARRFV